MDYSSSLGYLYSLQHFGIKLGLDNTRMLLERLGNPQQKLRIVHIAGTNGKGSTATTLEQILRSSGQRTGLYTSPHLHSFTERIRIDNQPISEAEVVAQTQAIRSRIGDLNPTFFEFTTAMALRVFAQQEVDWVILETGLGGRLDSTNVVDPALCIITSIAIDHSAHLGDDLAQIAAEKGGIIKSGVPVISARQTPESQAVLQQIASEKESPYYLAGRDFDWSMPPDPFHYTGQTLSLPHIESGLAGTFQRENISLALAAAELLLGNEMISTTTSRQVLASLHWAGRLEWRGDILFDGAHNPHAAAALAAYLVDQDLNDLLWVVALKADKDAEGIFEPLLPHVTQVFTAPLDTEETIPSETLLQFANRGGLTGESLASPEEALRRALAIRKPGQKILVAGSLFLVAALRRCSISLSGVTI